MVSRSLRAGRFVKQPAGYRAFIPAPLPPDPPIVEDQAMRLLLSEADQAIGRLDGVAQLLPNPDLFVAMYVRREAVLSSQIEGTQSTLEDVLAYELDARGYEFPQDINEVVNYVRAMNYGLDRLKSLPLSLRLIREIHATLLTDVRGAEKQPGEFRTSQNWIGGGGQRLADAVFIPPPVPEMRRALDDFEKFLHEEHGLPVLLHVGLAHAQFETIHPFLDGNGRVGRLLITFLLVHRGVLQRPLLYLSHYLKRHRSEYYDRLTAIREDGDWEGWLRFFLRGVAETGREAAATAREIVALREDHRALVMDQGLGTNGTRLLDVLFQQPMVNANYVKDALGVSFVTADRLIDRLQELGLLHELTGARRGRRYAYQPYLDLLTEREPETADDAPVQTTETVLETAQ